MTPAELVTVRRLAALDATIRRAVAERSLLRAVPAAAEYPRLVEEVLVMRAAEKETEAGLALAMLEEGFPATAARLRAQKASGVKCGIEGDARELRPGRRSPSISEGKTRPRTGPRSRAA